MPLLDGEQVTFVGETLRASTLRPAADRRPRRRRCWWPPWGRSCCGIAGRLASGTVTWMTGPVTIESHIVPTIRAAAAEAGRPEPQVGVGLPVCVTADEAAARAKAAEVFAIYGHLPSYRAMLDREGAAGRPTWPSSGTASEVADQVRRLAAIGATDFIGAPFGTADEIRPPVGVAGRPGRELTARAGAGSGTGVGRTRQRASRVCLNSLSPGGRRSGPRTRSMVARAGAPSPAGRVISRTKTASSPTMKVGTPKTSSSLDGTARAPSRIDLGRPTGVDLGQHGVGVDAGPGQGLAHHRAVAQVAALVVPGGEQ